MTSSPIPSSASREALNDIIQTLKATLPELRGLPFLGVFCSYVRGE